MVKHNLAILAAAHGKQNGLDFALELTKRREQISKIHHVCPACHAAQVQLVSWTSPIVIRKCRICKHVHQQFIPEQDI